MLRPPTLRGYVATKKSTALPVDTQAGTGIYKLDFETTAGSSQSVVSDPTSAVAAARDFYLGKWISDPITVSAIDANTWTLALAGSESGTNLNAFWLASIYVLTSGDTVRTPYIYDSHTSLGIELTTAEDGQVLSVSGVGGHRLRLDRPDRLRGLVAHGQLDDDVADDELLFRRRYGGYRSDHHRRRLLHRDAAGPVPDDAASYEQTHFRARGDTVRRSTSLTWTYALDANWTQTVATRSSGCGSSSRRTAGATTP